LPKSSIKKPDASKLSIPGPESIVRQTLSNGIVVLVRENHASPAVVISGLLRAGSMFDSKEKAGLAAFASDMVERGTKTRTYQQIAEETERVGASVGLSIGRHTAGFGGKGLAEDFDLLVDVLGDMVQDPVFPPAEVEKVRGEMLTDIKERDDDTRSVAELEFRALAYPNGHPYGLASDGYTETVQAITRDDLVAFYQKYYRPEGMIIAVVGDVNANQVVEKLEKAFGTWRATGQPVSLDVPPVPRASTSRQKTVTMKDKTQTDIVVGFPGLLRTDPDYYAAAMADLILGGLGMMGRLGDSVRDKMGLAYYVYSRLEAGLGPGPWAARAGVNPKNVDKAIEGILAEMKRLRAKKVMPRELADAKDYVTGAMPLRLETNEGVAGALLDMELFDLGLDYLQRYPDIIRAITAEQIRAAAAKYLDPEAYTLVVVGP